jgi:hypothetical protein
MLRNAKLYLVWPTIQLNFYPNPDGPMLLI